MYNKLSRQTNSHNYAKCNGGIILIFTVLQRTPLWASVCFHEILTKHNAAIGSTGDVLSPDLESPNNIVPKLKVKRTATVQGITFEDNTHVLQ